MKKYRLGGLLYGKLEDGDWSGPLSKVEADYLATIDGRVEDGDLVLIGAGPASHVNTAMGRLRAHVARQRDLIPQDAFAFVWVTDFPAFEHDEDNDRWVSVHHPFYQAD